MPVSTYYSKFLSNSSYESTANLETLSGFQRGQIVCACLAGTPLTKTAAVLGVSRAAVNKVVTAHTNRGKTSPAKKNSGRKPKLSGKISPYFEEDCVKKNHKTTAAKVIVELSIQLQSPVSTRTVRREH